MIEYPFFALMSPLKAKTAITPSNTSFFLLTSCILTENYSSDWLYLQECLWQLCKLIPDNNPVIFSSAHWMMYKCTLTISHLLTYIYYSG